MSFPATDAPSSSKQEAHRPSRVAPAGSHSFAAAPAEENFVEGLDGCLDSIKRGLKYFTEAKKKYDTTRDYVDSVMATQAPDAQTLPIQITKILEAHPLMQSEMHDIDAAKLLLQRFQSDLEDADGPLYRGEAMKACRGALSETQLDEPLSKSEFDRAAFKLITSPKMRASLATLKINSRWARVHMPAQAAFETSYKRLSTENFVDDYDDDAAIKQAVQVLKIPGLSETEYFAIRSYTGSGFRPINAGLRLGVKRKPDQFDIQPIVDMTDSGLSKLPNFTGFVNRGGELPADQRAQHTVGATVVYPAFTSTSRGNGFGSRDRFVIQSYTGKSIDRLSRFNNEEEVLFRPGARFKILHIENQAAGFQNPATTTYYMEEVAAEDDTLDAPN